MGISTVILATGTMAPSDNLDGWTITSGTATVKDETDIELRRGDKISVNGDVLRRGRIIARVDLKVGDWSDPSAAARALGRRTSAKKKASSPLNGLLGGKPHHLRGGRPRKDGKK